MRHLKFIIFTISCIFCSLFTFAQTATVKGQITDMDLDPLSVVTISIDKTDNFVLTDSLGNYSIAIPSGKRVILRARVMGYEPKPFSVNAKDGEIITKNIALESYGYVMDDVRIIGEKNRTQIGAIDVFDPNKVTELPSTIGGIEGQIKVVVGSRNELTSQYTVRGGNFDENLVYVNDFEINRPFLVRSGQQEGLSFVNSDLTRRVEFSIGGFQAKYGDKMSSVLDVTYKRPEKFAGSAMVSLLGFQAHLEGGSKNNKLSYMVGFRQKSNQYLLQSQPTKGQYTPTFTDIQALINYRFNKKLELEFIGNYAINRFKFLPESVRSAFGSATEALAFSAIYEGGENDQFDNTFGGLSLTYSPNKNFKLKLLASMFQSQEKETFDILTMYRLSAVELNLGSSGLGNELYSLGSGEIHRYARNFLNSNVKNIGFKGNYNAGAHYFTFGSNLQHVIIDDRMLEWERRDSAGFTVPFDPFKVNMYSFIKANNSLDYNKIDAYIQDNIVLTKDKNVDAILLIGLRGTYNFLNKEMIWSPRVNFSFKPDWKENVIFKLAGGLYAQPPFYREMRAMDGTLNEQIKAQKSLHIAAGVDYNFMAFNKRPFKFTAELFYKSLWDLVPYQYDNVRIRYAANNDGMGYAYGGEVRLFGDLVKNAESWLSVGYLKTMEKIYNHTTNEYGAYQPRPTDGRVTFGVFFSDYLPQNHNFKVFINLMYATGLPVAVPKENFKHINSFRLPDYKRIDIGFSALLLDAAKKRAGYYSFFKGIKSVWASFEVFNLMGISNTLSYEYIESLNSNFSYYVPNRLTARMLNLKLAVKF